jgi:hypothetical protein
MKCSKSLKSPAGKAVSGLRTLSGFASMNPRAGFERLMRPARCRVCSALLFKEESRDGRGSVNANARGESMFRAWVVRGILRANKCRLRMGYLRLPNSSICSA